MTKIVLMQSVWMCVWMRALYVYMLLFLVALTLAINRDGSSGGVARMACITKEGIERKTILYPDLPKMFDG